MRSRLTCRACELAGLLREDDGFRGKAFQPKPLPGQTCLSRIQRGGHYHSAADSNTFMIIWNSELDTGEAQARVSAEFSDSGLLGLMSESEVIVEDPKFRVCADKA